VGRYIEEHRGRFGVEPICSVLGVSASAYYQRKTGQRSARSLEDERLLGRIREGVVFFGFVIDVFSRKVVGWQFAAHMRTTLQRSSSMRCGWRSRPESACRRSASFTIPTRARNIWPVTTRKRSPTTTSWRRSEHRRRLRQQHG
jgi:transposase InsO family protein